MKKPLIVGITGASGVIYGVRFIQVLVQSQHQVALVISDAARIVFQEEMRTAGFFKKPSELESVFGEGASRLVEVFSPKDFTAPIASGSYPVSGMAIIPCSMGSLGAIAGGMSGTLIHRAADCVLKEGKRLVLVPRETPLSAVHLENMLKLARLGVRIVPAMPGFYSGAASVEELVDFMVGKVLDQFDIAHTLYPRWTGLHPKPERGEDSFNL